MRRAVPAVLICALASAGCPALLPGEDIHDGGAPATADATGGAHDGAGLDEDAASTHADATATNEDAAMTGEDAENGDAAANHADAGDAAENSDATSTNADATASNADAAEPADTGPMCGPLFGQPCSLPGLCGATYDCNSACSGGTTAPTCPCGTPTCSGNTWICAGGCCDPRAGLPCDRFGYCGAVYDCSGICTGGSTAPACTCSTPFCDMSGHWTACTDPPNLGDVCSTDSICGGTVACGGTCTGGQMRPPCVCSMPVCQSSGSWTDCTDPMDLGTTCNTMSTCGGAIACDGTCAGGSPLPACQCGTPTCAGCIGGTCDANSACVSGLCQCTVNDCSCGGGAGVPSCTICDGGNVDTCTVDAFGCGAASLQTSCSFGCDPMTTTCLCSPDTGAYCVAGMCTCACGDFERPGTTQCDGSCRASAGCAAICRAECGPN